MTSKLIKRTSRVKGMPTASQQHVLSPADLIVWISESSHGGIAVVSSGKIVLENRHFHELMSAVKMEGAKSLLTGITDDAPLATRHRLVRDASTWSHEPIGSRGARSYSSISWSGSTLRYEARFTVVPHNGDKAVLIVIEDITQQTQMALEAVAIGRFQSVLARIGALAVSGVPVQEIMNEAVRLTADALNVELCKILIPRESDDHLYLMAGVGWREGLIGTLTVEGGTHSQAGYAIRERKPVVVRDLRTETRFTPSTLLAEHSGIAGMSVPMMVQDRVYGVMGAHCKTVREFTEKELEFLRSVANTIATVLERWRREETQLQLYHRLFELVQDGIMFTDAHGRLLDWNPSMERMTGWTRAEVIGKTPALLKSGKHPPEFYERLWSAIRNGQAFADRFVNRRKDGSEFQVWESISPVKDPDGTIRFYLAILTDLTERERMLEVLRHAEQMKLVGQLAGGILHEIRNPLIGIGSLATHLAQRQTIDATVRDKCRLIAQEASRIDDILESHLGQLPPRPFDFRQCDLPVLLEDTLALLHPKLTATRITVVTDIGPDLPMIEASHAHLQQVWLNVVMNAIEAMPNGGRLTVRMAPANRGVKGVLISFADSGTGITAENLRRIYEPFFTSGKARGVGLGLTISRDIIERHQGQFVITSQPANGAVVEIWLPLTQKA